MIAELEKHIDKILIFKDSLQLTNISVFASLMEFYLWQHLY